ncbi:putative armadillo-like helical, importin beta family [Helianthus annuus]|nr:putative armadillo-like helical, importin beta family [Helianthus annuus]
MDGFNNPRVQEHFQKYYDAVMPYLKAILVNANDKANRMLRAKAMECISLVGMAVGKEKIKDDAKQGKFVSSFIQREVGYTDILSSTGRTEVDFEENRPIDDHAQLSVYQRVSIEDVLNPRPANPIPIPISSSSSSAANEFSIDERVYTSEVQASATPVVGMQFISIEQAYAFYQSYAKLAGFSIRKGGEV